MIDLSFVTNRTMASRAVAATVVEQDPRIFEEKNVHAVYDEIASHFSSTRYKVSFQV